MHQEIWNHGYRKEQIVAMIKQVVRFQKVQPVITLDLIQVSKESIKTLHYQTKVKIVPILHLDGYMEKEIKPSTILKHR